MHRHRASLARRRAGPPAWRLLVLVAAFGGLFAMHGLSDHGSAHHGSVHPGSWQAHGSQALHEARHEVPHGDHLVAAAPAAATTVLDVAASGDALGEGVHAVTGLCLAVLAGAAALASRRPRPWFFALGRDASVVLQRQLLVRSRAPDPPDLHDLSVQRC